MLKAAATKTRACLVRERTARTQGAVLAPAQQRAKHTLLRLWVVQLIPHSLNHLLIALLMQSRTMLTFRLNCRHW